MEEIDIKGLHIRTYPDPILKEKSVPIVNFDDSLRNVIDQMEEVMFEKGGIGLAAPQVGVSSRLILADDGERNIALVNPEIVEKDGRNRAMEGCLSLPGLELEIERWERIEIAAKDPYGKSIEFEARDLFARVLQHEIDHLDGFLIIDRISTLKKQLIRSRLKRMRENWIRATGQSGFGKEQSQSTT
jgi:peptide deformylase